MDVSASQSNASTATSGAKFDFSHQFGDFIVGGKKDASPPWLTIAIVAAVGVVAVIFLIRR